MPRPYKTRSIRRGRACPARLAPDLHTMLSRCADMTTTGIVLLIAAVIVLAVLAWYLVRERRSKRLRSRFSPEYEDAMRRFGDKPRAEDALAKREKRMEKVHVRSLSHD